MLINTTSHLIDICEELIVKKPKFIAVDTEFFKNKSTYYPKLSLIQISYENKSFIIDALVPEIDLSFVKKIMLNSEIFKIFHSCKQDIESLFKAIKCIPKPIFDTQVAAMFCHYYHDFIGYSKIVKQYQGIILNKIKAKNSNWLRRPLSNDQLEYAISDVAYLCELQKILYNKLEQKNRIRWFEEEMETVININRYLNNPKDAWKKIKFNYEKNPKLILIIKSVSEWQEILAQKYNVNRNKIIDNSVIIRFIEKKIECVDEILDNLRKNAKNVKEEELLEFIDIFNENKKSYFIQQNHTLLNYYDKSILDMLSIILDSECKKNEISRKLVSSKNELALSISGHIDKLFKGWRYNFFGKSVKSFLNEKSRFEISLVKCLDKKTKIESKLVSNID